jgi:hypothetical protein
MMLFQLQMYYENQVWLEVLRYIKREGAEGSLPNTDTEYYH